MVKLMALASNERNQLDILIQGTSILHDML
jgi:hypothetical protein